MIHDVYLRSSTVGYILQIYLLYPVVTLTQVVHARLGGLGPSYVSHQDWGCEVAELLAAEEDEQPKVAIRRLILETWLGGMLRPSAAWL